MSVLMWEKPEQAVSKESWKSRSADSAPPGAYTSNMSVEDLRRWKACVKGHTKGYPQVELRRDGMVIVLSTDGYKYKSYDTRGIVDDEDNMGGHVHIVCSGPVMLSLAEYDELQTALYEGWRALRLIAGTVHTFECDSWNPHPTLETWRCTHCGEVRTILGSDIKPAANGKCKPRDPSEVIK